MTQATNIARLACDVALLAAGPEHVGPRKFSIDPAYSGGPVRLDGWPLPLVIDLATLQEGKRVTANLDHDRTQRVGHSTEIVNDKSSLKIAGLVSGATPAAKQFEESSDGGFSWGASIEVAFQKQNVTELARGKTEKVNGQSIVGPALIGRHGTLFGIAMTDSPADPSTNVFIAASAAKRKDLDMNFAQWLANLELDPATLSDAQVAKLTAKFEAEKVGTAPDASRTLDEVLLARKSEETRQTKIATLTEQALADYPGKAPEVEAIARLALSQSWNPEKFELEILRAGRPQAGQFRGGSRSRPDAKVIEAALCMSAGLPNVEKVFSAETLEAVDRHNLRQIGLQEVILMAAAQNGYSCRPGERILAGNLRTILEHAMPPAIIARAAGFSSVSLPGILGAVGNREVTAGYQEDTNPTWKELCTIKNSSNFLAVNIYRMNDDLEFEPLGPAGEIAHGKLTESGRTRKVGTTAKMLGLTREAIINDDAGAFDQIRVLLGQGGNRKFVNLFWKTFIEGIATMFTTAKGNYIEGSTTNLLADGVALQALELKFRQMKTAAADGAKRLTGRPEILVHPPELSVIARKHFISGGTNTGGSSTAASVPNGNVFEGLYRPLTIDQLSDTALSSAASATGWGLFRNKGVLAPMVVSYLNNVSQPVIESAEADFSHAGGILFRGIFDVGANVAEDLAGAWSKGAA